MRLINTETLELGEFFQPQVPVYAILSHTWEKDELTLREWTEPSTATTSKAGYKKVCKAASLSRRSGLAWLWVDTVCIDKTSSAELSEAINSMFNCNEAAICYAFLADVSKDSLAEAPDDAPENNDEQRPNLSQFRASRWFTRGWTLQELIAPRTLVFYSREWARLGTKASFADDICSITGIETPYLGPTEIARGVFTTTALGASVATRMSWLAKRQTTRIEDMAYCMLGIFDINMPLLCGEAHKAFWRLQEEIIRVHDDQSIFVWKSFAGASPQHLVPVDGTIGFLAEAPQYFQCASPAIPLRHTALPSPYTMTNAGLSITLPLIHTINGYIGILSAARPGDHGNVGVFMRRDDTGQMSRIVSPPMPLRVCLHPSRFDLTSIHVKAVDRRQKVPHRLPTYSPSRSGNGLVVSLRKNMERHAPSFFSFPAESLQSQAPESAATLVFPSADELPEFYARDEVSDVRAITTGVILGATPLKPDVVTLWASFCLVLTRTAICDLKTGRVDYRYTAVRLGHYPRSRTLWLALVCSQETKLAVSDIVQERNAWFLSRYVQAMEYTSRSSAWKYLGHGPHQEGGCHEYVEFGCCDMGHPDFDQLRLVHIAWPPAWESSLGIPGKEGAWSG